MTTFRQIQEVRTVNIGGVDRQSRTGLIFSDNCRISSFELNIVLVLYENSVSLLYAECSDTGGRFDGQAVVFWVTTFIEMMSGE